MSNRTNAYTEVYTILKELSEEEYNKIPSELIKALEENRNKEYIFELDDELELEEHILLPETKAILFNLFRDYLATQEQKKKILKMQLEERRKNELKKKEKYDINVFSKIENENNTNIESNLQIIEYKEKTFKKFLDRLRKFFKL